MYVPRALLAACLLLLAAPLMALEALVLEYAEWEVDGEPYAARALISPAFMRLDYGPDDAGFVLFDRGAGVIYSIQAEDQRILEISAADRGQPYRQGCPDCCRQAAAGH